jgi:nucleoside-diphosphate-sugar epimerase
MNVLITGATGFLGGHLSRILVGSGHSVVALTRPTSDLSRLRALGARVRLLPCPPEAVEDLAGELEGIDAVVHAATCYGRKGEADNDVVRANLLFPLRLFEVACHSGVGTFLNLDTCFNTWPIRYKYLQSYTLSKRHFAEWGALLAEARAVRFVNLQLHHPYGPADAAGKFVPFVISECLAGRELKLTAGDQRKDFIYIDDVVDAIRLLLAKADGLPRGYHHFECGSGGAITVREFVETVHSSTGSTAKLCFGALPYREGEIMFSQADLGRLRQLGWAPRWGLREGIARILRIDHGLDVPLQRSEVRGQKSEVRSQPFVTSAF